MSTALLVIDAQKIYTTPGSDLHCADAKGTLKRINELIRLFEARSDPLVFVRHVHKKDGSDLGRLFDFSGEAEEEFNFVEGSQEAEYSEGLVRPAGSSELVKNRYSAFAGTKLDQQLRKLGVDKVAICGFMTNFCCESTARSAHDLDYYVDFIVDATGSPGTENMDEKEIRKVVGELLGAGFAVVSKTAAYLKKRPARR
ncbi:MAG: isochorismatase family cysteine hydrolase [Phycisphaerales bacterium]